MQLTNAAQAMGITVRHLRKLMANDKVDYRYIKASVTSPTVITTVVDISRESVSKYLEGK